MLCNQKWVPDLADKCYVAKQNWVPDLADKCYVAKTECVILLL